MRNHRKAEETNIVTDSKDEIMAEGGSVSNKVLNTYDEQDVRLDLD